VVDSNGQSDIGLGVEVPLFDRFIATAISEKADFKLRTFHAVQVRE